MLLPIGFKSAARFIQRVYNNSVLSLDTPRLACEGVGNLAEPKGTNRPRSLDKSGILQIDLDSEIENEGVDSSLYVDASAPYQTAPDSRINRDYPFDPHSNEFRPYVERLVGKLKIDDERQESGWGWFKKYGYSYANSFEDLANVISVNNITVSQLKIMLKELKNGLQTSIIRFNNKGRLVGPRK